MYTVNSLRDPSYFNHSIALCSRHVCVMHNQTRTVSALLFHTRKQFMAYFSVRSLRCDGPTGEYPPFDNRLFREAVDVGD
jgi:hypothetical protein